MNIPTDDQFFSRTDRTKPDIAFLKNHLYREGRLSEDHALYIIEKATEILKAEPNLLSVDAPVTGACFVFYLPVHRLTCIPYNLAVQSAVIFMDNM